MVSVIVILVTAVFSVAVGLLIAVTVPMVVAAATPGGESIRTYQDVKLRAARLERAARKLGAETWERWTKRRLDMRREREEGRPVYRSRSGAIFGVCRGIAEYLGFSVFMFRVIVVVVAIPTGIWPVVGAYILAALLMKPEPVVPFEEESEQEFYDSYVNSRTMALSRLKRTFENLERRIRRMENLVTAREYDWERRFNER